MCHKLSLLTSLTKLSAADLLEEAQELEKSITATLYVRNLNFTTTTERLTEAFKPLSGFRSAKVQTKMDPKRGALSMGFGFVEFTTAETATAALSTMDGRDLEGHKLQIKASHKGADAAEERRRDDAAKKAASTRILIKNLPFEANVRTLYSLCKARANLGAEKRSSRVVHPLRPASVRQGTQEIRFVLAWVWFRRVHYETRCCQRHERAEKHSSARSTIGSRICRDRIG